MNKGDSMEPLKNAPSATAPFPLSAQTKPVGSAILLKTALIFPKQNPRGCLALVFISQQRHPSLILTTLPLRSMGRGACCFAWLS